MWRRILRSVTRPFTRPERPPLSDDWRAGDLAECIGNDWSVAPERRPKAGSRSLVVAVEPGHGRSGPGWGLVLARFPGAWDARGFRKVPPAAAAEPRHARQTAFVE